MATAFDAVGSATLAYSNVTATSPFTFNHTNGGSATVLVVAVYSDGGDYTTWTATYNGVAMTRISGTVPTYPSAVFALKSPATGTNVFSCTHDNAGGVIYANSISYTGSDTTGTGWGTFAVGVLDALGHPVGTVSSATGDLVVAFVRARSAVSGSPDGGGTKRFSTSLSERLGGYEIAGSASTSIGWTVDSGDDAYVMGVSIPSAGAGGLTTEYVAPMVGQCASAMIGRRYV